MPIPVAARMLADFLFPISCPGCDDPRPGGRDRGPCPDCARALSRPAPRLPVPAGLDGLLAATRYEGPARALVLRAKAGHPALLGPLGDRLGSVCRACGLGERVGLVVAVPSHPWRRWRRGFDPARDIARGVAGCLGRPLRPVLARRWLALRPSKGLPASARRNAVSGAFRTREPVPGQKVLLVDDVATTGATLAACAEALRAAGAAEVWGAVWARTPRGL